MRNDTDIRQRVCTLAREHDYANAQPDDLELLALGGSDRCFYRVRADSTTCVAMVSPPPGDEQQAWYDINTLLHSCGICVPRVLARDDNARILLVEDAGDENMYRALHAATDRHAVHALYKEAIELLSTMQVHATPRMHTCPCLRQRRFDYAAFRYETNYFTRSFLREYCGVEKPDRLDEEFHRMAETLAAEETVFMHRDFQSQNIHLLGGRLIVIDFQTATAGPPHYDLVSLLKDAYFVLQPDERTSYLQDYFTARAHLDSAVDDPAAFTRTFHLCGLQRTMQALAAFSYLATYKKKTQFLAHIPAALSCLVEALNEISVYPCLTETASTILERMPRPVADTGNQG